MRSCYLIDPGFLLISCHDILRISTKIQPKSVNPEGNATSVVEFHCEPYLGQVTTSVITTVDFYSVADM